MRVRFRELFALTMLSMLIAPALAAAQDPVVLGAGVAITRTSETGIGAAVNFSQMIKPLSNGKSIGWVADVGFNRYSDFRTLIFGGGVRVKLAPHGKWTFFGQLEAGVIHESEDFFFSVNEFGIAPGIGAILTRPNGMRLFIQADLGLVNGTSIVGTRFLVGILLDVTKK